VFIPIILSQQSIKEKDGVQRTLNHTETVLQHSIEQNAASQKEIVALNTKVADLMKRMAKDSDNTRMALEKAITASVRLCVVAPTVNVHVSDKKLKFKSGYVFSAVRASCFVFRVSYYPFSN
jgi:hypothetical protein